MYYFGGYINKTSDGDLTVTVTPKEYRELCRESAGHDGELTKLSNENRELTDPEYGEEE